MNVAYINWTFGIECPVCQEHNDLTNNNHDSDNKFAVSLFNNDWEALHGTEIVCEHCGAEFKIEDVRTEYICNL